MAAIYDIGCFVGCIVAFLGAEKFGRMGSLMWGSWIMEVGKVLQAGAYENIQMILSRVVSGIGNGINTCAVSMWQAECFQAHNRGAMLVIQSTLIALGHPLSTFMGLASSQAEPDEFSWRWPIAFPGVFCVLFLRALPGLPEPPRWLVAHDRVDEAQEVSARLVGKNGLASQHLHVLAQLNDIKAHVAEEHRIGEASWTEVFTGGKLRNLSRVLLGAGPYMFN